MATSEKDVEFLLMAYTWIYIYIYIDISRRRLCTRHQNPCQALTSIP